MSLVMQSTKAFHKLPCAHAQWFDTNIDGTPGDCASLHGYDRSVILTFEGEVDEHGWVFPFGKLKEVRKFLEYYFDHTTVLPADDPRLASVENTAEHYGLLGTLRVLPYGVSMEMSALFIWEHVNAYVYHITHGRVTIVRVECIEHDSNAASLNVDNSRARLNARNYRLLKTCYLPMQPRWDFVAPLAKIEEIMNT